MNSPRSYEYQINHKRGELTLSKKAYTYIYINIYIHEHIYLYIYIFVFPKERIGVI